jgi:hypothetical protein
MTLETGAILPNGARVVEARGDVVLAHCGGYHPYVTWQVDQCGNAFWGHYFEDISTAVADYNERAKGYFRK